MRLGARIGQRRARGDDGAGKADDAADQRHPRRAEPEGAAAGEAQRQHVLDDDELDVERVVEAGTHQGRIEIEQPVRHRCAERQRDQAVGKREADAGRKHDRRTDREPDRDEREGDVERSAQRRVLAAHALGVEARRPEPQPIEKAGLYGHGGGEREGKAPVFLRAQELRDDEPDRKVEEHVDEEGDENLHAGSAPAGRPLPLGSGSMIATRMGRC